jgi:hypothetical protein
MRTMHTAADAGEGRPGRQGREGRDFVSRLKTPLYPLKYWIFHIHGRRRRAREGENNRGVFSRPSRPTRPDSLAQLCARRTAALPATICFRHAGDALASPLDLQPASTLTRAASGGGPPRLSTGSSCSLKRTRMRWQRPPFTPRSAAGDHQNCAAETLADEVIQQARGSLKTGGTENESSSTSD